MKKTSVMALIAGALAGFGMNFYPRVGGTGYVSQQRPRSRKGGRDKSNLPHGYPGAKMARMAIMKRVGVRHLGLRLDGVTV